MGRESTGRSRARSSGERQSRARMGPSTAWRRGDESGSGSVLTAAAIAVVLLVVVVGLALGGAVLAAGRASAAADLAALAAATAVQSGSNAQSACEAAAQIAVANRAIQTGCTVAGEMVEVTCAARLPMTWPGTPKDAKATARAGPQD